MLVAHIFISKRKKKKKKHMGAALAWQQRSIFEFVCNAAIHWHWQQLTHNFLFVSIAHFVCLFPFTKLLPINPVLTAHRKFLSTINTCTFECRHFIDTCPYTFRTSSRVRFFFLCVVPKHMAVNANTITFCHNRAKWLGKNSWFW